MSHDFSLDFDGLRKHQDWLSGKQNLRLPLWPYLKCVVLHCQWYFHLHFGECTFVGSNSYNHLPAYLGLPLNISVYLWFAGRGLGNAYELWKEKNWIGKKDKAAVRIIDKGKENQGWYERKWTFHFCFGLNLFVFVQIMFSPLVIKSVNFVEVFHLSLDVSASEFQIWLIIIIVIIVYWSHYLFSDWLIFKSSTIRTFKFVGNHVMYDRAACFVRVIMSSSCALCCLPSV